MEFIKVIKGISALPWKALIYTAVGTLLIVWIINTPGGLLGKADAIGYAVCHRIDLRSFHLGERQLPLCARCSGMYLGAMLALLYQAILGRRRAGSPKWYVWVVLALFFVAFGVDGVNSYLQLFPLAPSLYQPHNSLRLLTGTGVGLGIGVALFPAFNQTIWKDWDPLPALPGLAAFGWLLLLVLGMDGLVLSENSLVLYPLALISAAGVLILLTMVYTMLWLMLLRYENRIQNLAQLLLPLTGGFGLALLQIAVLDFVRFLLTGTWDGFHLG